MQEFQRNFIDFALATGVLKFGQFTLKSGRVSPYFFNAGLFQDGQALMRLGECYADAIAHFGLQADLLFGPAYKGIPLVSTLAVALAHRGHNLPWAFNRKEAKAHGEGGTLVGAAVEGRVLIVDDVITAGTAIGEVMDLMVKQPKAQVAHVLVALDRQERGQGALSAIQEVKQRFNIEVHAIVTLSDLLNYLQDRPELAEHAMAVQAYQQQYGVITGS